jgi:secondary thiamine-phosphate synthase enzyme
MSVRHTSLKFRTSGPGLTEITESVRAVVAAAGVGDALLTLFIRHTSASLLIQENADPDVQKDLLDFFARLAPWDATTYRHTTEGEDDMPAHLRAALTATSLQIPVVGGRLGLGTWQGVYLFEHRAGRQEREVLASLVT